MPLFRQKPVDEVGKAYVEFMRANVEQIRHRISDELYILTIFEVGVFFHPVFRFSWCF